MMRNAMILAGAALLLASCGSKEGAGNDSGGAAASSEQTQGDTPNASDGNDMVPIPPQPSPTPVTGGIPADYQGRWGMVPEDCLPTNKQPKGLMIVSGDGLGFDQVRGAVEKIVATTPGTLTLNLEFTGGGQQYLRQETLTLLDDGKTLVRQEQKPAGSFRYSKCPAGKEEPQT